jgi:hypothetical protein
MTAKWLEKLTLGRSDRQIFEGKNRSKKDYSASLAFVLPLASYLAFQCERFKKKFHFFPKWNTARHFCQSTL